MVGAVLGNYQLVRKLGKGGMGVVYLGQHTLLGRQAAIKVLLPTLSARPDIVHRFFNEARAVTSISDPGIVQVFDFGYHTDGRAFILMEYLEGEPLDRRLARLGRLPAVEALRLCRQLASSLAAAHARGIIHRDLKPENIFLVPDPEVASGERTKILDFGIAKLSDDHPDKLSTSTGMLMGTPAYMSPEQCRGLKELDHRSDIYALGCVLFRMLTGRPPFDGEGPGDIISAHIREPAPPPSRHTPELPAGVDALVLRCLAKAPAARYRTMVELANVLAEMQQLPGDAASAASPQQLAPMVNPPRVLAQPTTLGRSSGQFVATHDNEDSSKKRSGIGRWMTGIVAGAVVLGLAMVVMHRGTSTDVAQAPNPSESHLSVAPAAPSADAATTAAQDRGPTAAHGTDGERSDTAASASASGAEAVATSDQGVDPASITIENEGTSDEVVISDDDGSDAPQPSRGAGSATEPSKKSAHRAHKAAASSAPPGSSRGSAASSSKCAKATFSAVYNAAAPPRPSVDAALRNLQVCHAEGVFSEAEFNQYHRALMAKLLR